MDLETFLTIVYTLVDDWYKGYVQPQKPKRGGPAPQMSDSEVLTLSLVLHWQPGTPWKSERALVRWVHAHGRGLFPHMLERSAFNARARRLWGAFLLLQQAVAALLETPEALYEGVDSMPVPAMSNSQALREAGHWLWESTTGHGGTQGGFFCGDHVLISVSRRGAITGWLLAAAHIQDRWLLEAFLSARAGCPQLVLPPPNPHGRRLALPVGHLGPIQAAGAWTPRPYLADQGFNGAWWRDHWRQDYHAEVISVPPRHTPQHWPPVWKSWLARLRQIVDTTFAFLTDVFGLQRVNAHSRWGHLHRIAAKMAMYNIGLFINRMLERPQHAFATLIV